MLLVISLMKVCWEEKKKKNGTEVCDVDKKGLVFSATGIACVKLRERLV